MQITDLSLAAAELAEQDGWQAVTAAGIARHMKVHNVSVSRSASIKDIRVGAQELVMADGVRYPRAAIEMRLGKLTHTQRGRVLHALAKETSRP